MATLRIEKAIPDIPGKSRLREMSSADSERCVSTARFDLTRDFFTRLGWSHSTDHLNDWKTRTGIL